MLKLWLSQNIVLSIMQNDQPFKSQYSQIRYATVSVLNSHVRVYQVLLSVMLCFKKKASVIIIKDILKGHGKEL